MNRLAVDRNLLTGILGLQTGLLTESQLIAAMQAWVFSKQQLIEEILISQGVIDSAQKQFLQQLTDQYLAVNNGSPEKALTKLPKPLEFTKSLDCLGDTDVSSVVSLLGIHQTNSDSIEFSGTQLFDEDRLKDGRYRVLRPHAHGGLGTVSVAEDLQLHREVALKRIKKEFVQSAESRSRFLMEAEVTGRLEHPGIVPVYSLGFTESEPFYVMRFVRGQSLKEAVDNLFQQRTSLSIGEFTLQVRKLVQILIDVGHALSYAHSRGVLHRDVKPGNIMLGKFGETLLVDWGLAKVGASKPESNLEDEATFVPLSGDSSKTRMGSIIGTLAYMSPEQANGRLDLIGPHSDVYSLGATLYCVLTGDSPYGKSTAEETLEMVRQGRYPEATSINPDIPKALNAICKKAMAPNIVDRYPSSIALIEDLELWLADEPVDVYAEPLAERLLRKAKRHRSAVAASAAVLVTALLGLLTLNYVTQKQNVALQRARDDATNSKAIAEENLDTVEQLSLVLLNSAEEKLSDPAFSNNAVTRNLRLELTEAAIESFEKIAKHATSNFERNKNYAEVLRISANLQRVQRKFDIANQRFSKSIELQEQVPRDKQTASQLDYLALTYRDLAVLQNNQGNLKEALKSLKLAETLNEQHRSQHGDGVRSRRTKVLVLIEQARLHENLDHISEAISLAQRAGELQEAVCQSEEKKLTDDSVLIGAKSQLVDLLSQGGEIEKAEQVAVEAIEHAGPLVKVHPEDGTIVVPYCKILYLSAENLLKNPAQYQLVAERLTESVKRLGEVSAKTKQATHLLAYSHALRIRAAFFRKQKEYGKAEEAISVANRTLDAIVKASPSSAFMSYLAEVLLERAKIKMETNDIVSAKTLISQARQYQQKALEESPLKVYFKTLLESIEAESKRINSYTDKP